MPNQIAWNRRLYSKLGGITLLLLLVSGSVIAVNVYMLDDIKRDTAERIRTGQARERAYEYLYLSHRMFVEGEQERAAFASSLRRVMRQSDAAYQAQLDGDANDRDWRVEDPELRAALETQRRLWTDEIKPILFGLLQASSAEQAEPLLASLRKELRARDDLLAQSANIAERAVAHKVNRFQILQYAFLVIVAIVLVVVFRLGQNVARRIRALALTAERIAAGEHEVQAPLIGSDEITVLGRSFNTMTSKLRQLLEDEQANRKHLEQLLAGIAEVTNALASGTSEILAATTQQASGAREQAAAVSETVTTVDEVTQTADQAAQRARSVADASQRALEIAKAGRGAVEETITAMNGVKDHVEGIAERIVALAEQAHSIGDVIATVDDIAEQTNLLALNASIEAARAGEHGKGFAVVASEVKALAEQAKKATAHVRQILSDIQKATHGAVLSTEEGVKNVNSTTQRVTQAGETIRTLSGSFAETAQSAAQIAASAGQQAAGMSQINQAMRQVDQATNQNLASTRQQERAAQDLNALGVRLQQLTVNFQR